MTKSAPAVARRALDAARAVLPVYASKFSKLWLARPERDTARVGSRSRGEVGVLRVQDGG